MWLKVEELTDDCVYIGSVEPGIAPPKVCATLFQSSRDFPRLSFTSSLKLELPCFYFKCHHSFCHLHSYTS